MSKVHQIISFFKYKKHAVNEHGIHSPFVFELYNEAINVDSKYYCYDAIEAMRAKLLLVEKTIEVNDFGAGSKIAKSNNRKISTIAKTSLKPKKYAQLLFRLVNYFKPKSILELGTSLGITTMYLSASNSKTQIYTVEGCNNLAKVAVLNFHKIGYKNIKQINKKFDDFIPEFIKENSNIDFVYIDGNHTKNATLKYFNHLLSIAHNNTVFVFDDIYWSKQMTEAWEEIKKNKRVTTTIDLYYLGIVFLKKELSKEHFVLKY